MWHNETISFDWGFPNWMDETEPQWIAIALITTLKPYKQGEGFKSKCNMYYCC